MKYKKERLGILSQIPNIQLMLGLLQPTSQEKEIQS